MSVLRLISVIKKLTLKLNKEIGVFLFINNTIKGMQETIGDIATKDASKDGFLYASLKKEDTFWSR